MSNTTLSELVLRDVLPQSIQADANLDAMADALDTELHAEVSAVQAYLPPMAGLDAMPTRILDLLAWQFFVAFYDPALTDDQKRNLIRNAIAFRRRQGTKAAVLDVVEAVFGPGNATVSEWFEFDGDPYTFRVETPLTFTPTNIGYLLRMIRVAKNVRSWMDLRSTREDSCPTHVGIISHRVIFRYSEAS